MPELTRLRGGDDIAHPADNYVRVIAGGVQAVKVSAVGKSVVYALTHQALAHGQPSPTAPAGDMNGKIRIIRQS
jgi:hypothetical protein